MKQDPIKFAVENHLNKELSKGSFSQEVLARVEQRIQDRITYYDELFKDDPEAKKIAVTFDDEERAMLATYEKYQNENHNKQEFKVNTFFRKRERIIKNFHGDGLLSKEQMKDLYWQDRADNPKKYLFSTNRRKIIKDWAKHFPEMDIVNNRACIQKRVGPLILSIFLSSKTFCPDCYYVDLSINHLLKIYPVSKKFVANSIINIELNKIEVADHNDGFYLDLVEMVKERFWLPLEGGVTFEQICNIPYKTKDNDFLNTGKFPYLKTLILICAWSGEVKMAQQSYEKALNYFKNLDKNIQEAMAYRLTGGNIFRVGDVALWEKTFIEQTQDYIKHPEKLRQIVQDNVKNFALEKIPYQDIVGVNYKEKQII